MSTKKRGQQIRDRLIDPENTDDSVVLLIDADIIAFRFAVVNEEVVTVFGLDGVEEKKQLSPGRAKDTAISFVYDMVEYLDADEVLLCFTGSNNFRKQLGAGYKHNREGLEKPELNGLVREELQKEFPWLAEDTLEADDLLGLLQGDSTIICTIDKDLNQIPGLHFNWDHMETYYVSYEDGLDFLYTQILTGDPGDGYIGVRGIGPVKAAKLLKDCYGDDELYEDMVVNIFKENGLTFKDYKIMRAMAEILKPGLYNWEEHRVDKSILELIKEREM